MSSAYETIEDAIRGYLIAATPAVGEGAPTPSVFRADRVTVYGGQLTDAEILEEIEKMKSNAPAALVYYAGGEGSNNAGNECDEEAIFHVIVVSAGINRVAVHRATGTGLYDLVNLIRSRVNGQIVGNELVWKGNQRLVETGRPPTASAMRMAFGTRINHGL